MNNARPKYILGVNSGYCKHDASAALLRDGALVSIIEQERISRNKQAWGELATASIEACLDTEGIQLADVAMVAFGWDEKSYAASNGARFSEAEFLGKLFPRRIFGTYNLPPIQYVSHHLAHAASAYWTSGFDHAAVLVLDARGEQAATTLAIASETAIEIVDTFSVAESLGTFYALAAEWCGVGYSGAGKLMGLAAYGTPTQRMPLTLTLRGYAFAECEAEGPISDKQFYHWQRKHLFDAFSRRYPYRQGDGSDVMAYADFAASVQAALEAAVLRLGDVISHRTPSRNLCLAGGVALNCAMNAAMVRAGIWDEVFIPPFVNDSGVSVGAALHAWHAGHPERSRLNSRLTHAYWGMSYSDCQIEDALKSRGVTFRKYAEDELIESVAEHLKLQRVVAWFQGRAEVGPRALGARSILANPCDRDMYLRVNRLKRREVWRPLAFSVLEEAFTTFFEEPYSSEFMLLKQMVRTEARALIPAVVHVDGTTRPQVVRKTTNARFWRLLNAVGSDTGVPGLLNTSLNVRGEPIVHSPCQAVQLFLENDIDLLAIGSYVASK